MLGAEGGRSQSAPGAQCKQPKDLRPVPEASACRARLGEEHRVTHLQMSPWKAQRITDLEKMSCGAGEFRGNTALFVASKGAEKRDS